jgi:hypothetical protein
MKIPYKLWPDLTSSERKVMIEMAAKKNQKMREWKGDGFWNMQALQSGDAQNKSPAELAAEEEAAKKRQILRCKAEADRQPLMWMPVSLDQVKAGWEQTAPGMMYGMDFPFSAKTLMKLGPEWLTKAMHKCGTLEASNKVVKINMSKSVNVDAGNNGAKFTFDVKYQRKTGGLHTELFAKIPYPMDAATKTDRLSSSVYKQPMDFYELNTYRLMDALFPFKIPKFYFGDISNETSNFILITERVKFIQGFGDTKKKKRGDLKPYEVEGPYDKCKDWQLIAPDKEYYSLIVRKMARLAGYHKAGRLGDEGFLSTAFAPVPGDPNNPMAWGMQPGASSGQDLPQMVAKKLETGLKFIADTAKVLFPEYVSSEGFQKKYTNTLMTVVAYQR